jgi:hypothetical protein
MKYIQWSFILSGGVLQLLVLGRMLRQGFRTFPLLFSYVVASFLAVVIEVAASLDLMRWTKYTNKYYWINEAVLQFLIFLLVLSLIYRAMEGNPQRASLLRLLVLGACAVAGLSLVFQWNDRLNIWMTEVSRNLSFAAVVLNMILWLALIRRRLPDSRLLMITGGLGIQMAGEAIGHSLRQLAIPSRSMALLVTGNSILSASHLIALFIWWQTLRRTAVVSVRGSRH